MKTISWLVLACALRAIGFPAMAQSTNMQFVCYASATNLTLRPRGMELNVRLDEPVVVAVASRPEKWGFFQFPKLERWQDGIVLAKWNLADDAIASYGKGLSGRAISKDGGKSWTESSTPEEHTGLLLPNGDRLRIVTPPAMKASDLQLPEPVGKTVDPAGKVRHTLFRHSELPPQLQGVCLSRLARGGKTWKEERAVLDDPEALRYSLGGLAPIVWWGDMRMASDNSIIAGIYPGYLLKPDGTADPSGNVFFYRSTDLGKTWKTQGRILYEPDLAADPKGRQRMGFTEPAYEILQDGSFLCVMRTSDGLGPGPMYLSRSTDQGRTWSRPEAFAPSGVLPKLLRLENGVLVLSCGRPGVQLRFTDASGAKHWSEALEMLPKSSDPGQISCGYTDLLTDGPDSFLLIYSDFKFPNTEKELRKAIKVRRVRVQTKQSRQ